MAQVARDVVCGGRQRVYGREADFFADAERAQELARLEGPWLCASEDESEIRNRNRNQNRRPASNAVDG